MKLTTLKKNPKNPRIIKDWNFQKLQRSIESFPQMMELRPIVIDEDNIILGGNMRFEAIKALGYEEVPDNWVVKVAELTEEQKKEFIIKDNVGFGEWDWDSLANEWDSDALTEWGLSTPTFDAPELDYSVLDEAETYVDDKLKEYTHGVKKAILIEFESDHYEEAVELVKYWRDKEAYIGGMLIEKLKADKGD